MVITVTCPSCSSSFPIDTNKLPEGGVSARCTECGDVFRIEKPAEPPPMEAPEAVSAELPTPGEEAEAQAPSSEGGEEPGEAEPEAPEEDGSQAPGTVGMDDDDASSVSAPSAEAEEAPVAEAEPELPPLPEAEEAPVAEAEPELPPLPEAEEEPVAEAEPELPPLPEPEEAPIPEAETAVETETAPVQGFTFGRRDPSDKARRLARVLVSDMILYNAERHRSALEAGTLVQDFDEEIQKSWKEYVEQVGEEMANGEGRVYWTNALNEILAKGREVF